MHVVTATEKHDWSSTKGTYWLQIKLWMSVAIFMKANSLHNPQSLAGMASAALLKNLAHRLSICWFNLKFRKDLQELIQQVDCSSKAWNNKKLHQLSPLSCRRSNYRGIPHPTVSLTQNPVKFPCLRDERKTPDRAPLPPSRKPRYGREFRPRWSSYSTHTLGRLHTRSNHM